MPLYFVDNSSVNNPTAILLGAAFELLRDGESPSAEQAISDAAATTGLGGYVRAAAYAEWNDNKGRLSGEGFDTNTDLDVLRRVWLSTPATIRVVAVEDYNLETEGSPLPDDFVNSVW